MHLVVDADSSPRRGLEVGGGWGGGAGSLACRVGPWGSGLTAPLISGVSGAPLSLSELFP